MGNPQDCGTTFAGLVPQAVALNPQIILVSGSSNDLGQDTDRLDAATVAMLQALHGDLPNAMIIGISTVWADTPPPAQITEISSQVESAVTGVGGLYVPIGQPLLGHREWMQGDDVHPTTVGQQQLAAAISAAIPPIVQVGPK